MESSQTYQIICPNCGVNIGCGDDCSVLNEVQSVSAEVRAVQTELIEANSKLNDTNAKLEDTNVKVLRLKERIAHIKQDVLSAFIDIVDKKDHYTHKHSVQVTKYALAIGYEMKISPEDIEILGFSAQLHDLGKISVSESILRKPGRLTQEEFEEVKKHPDDAVAILNNLDYMADVVEVIHCHHERWDGQGYPRRLRGEEIPLLSRIIAVADAVDAMSLSRSYRRPMTREDIIQELLAESGKQFDPDVVMALINSGVAFGL